MSALMNSLTHLFLSTALWAAGFFVVFGALARWFPNAPGQSLTRRRGLWVDVGYYFLSPLFYGVIYSAALAVATQAAYGKNATAPHGPLADTLHTLPLPLQCVMILLISDFFQYWLHRLFHLADMWRYHAIHHAPTEIDWLTGARFHPVNILVYSTAVSIFVALLGFAPAAFTALMPFNMVYSALVHANLNWNFGRWGRIFASPVFHRWHHSRLPAAQNKNFAPTFAFLDILFGTFYLPAGVQPYNFGIDGDPVPENFLGQLRYPFTQSRP